MKTCRKCLQTKDETSFHKRPDSPDGLRNDCKSCHKARCEGHRQKNLDRDRATKAANYKANREKMRAANERWKLEHPDKMRSYKRAWKARNPEAVKAWQWGPEEKKDYALRKKYGITLEGWNAIFAAQSGLCAICKRHQTEFTKGLHVDHDHDSGEIRGLLCGPCNQALGLFQDSATLLDAAAVYLRRSKLKVVGGQQA